MPRSVVALIISTYSILLYFRAKYIEDITRVRWREDTNSMFEWLERPLLSHTKNTPFGSRM